MADEGMSLDEYVRQTLIAIVGGVLAAQSDSKCGAYMGRVPVQTKDYGLMTDLQGNTVTTVNFSLATTVEDKRQGGGTAGIKVISLFEIKADGKGESSSSLVSRISFSVPISIPIPEQQRSDNEETNHQRAVGMAEASRRLTEMGRGNV